MCPASPSFSVRSVEALANEESKASDLTVSDTYLNLHATVLSDKSLTLATRALILRNPDGTGPRDDLRHLCVTCVACICGCCGACVCACVLF